MCVACTTAEGVQDHPQAPPTRRGRRGTTEPAEAVSALELPSESCALGRGALAQGFPPHGDVFSVAGGGHWGHGALGVASGSCEALAGSRKLARVKAARLGHPHPSRTESSQRSGQRAGCLAGANCEPRVGLRPLEASGVHTEGSRTLGNLSLAGGPGIRLGPPSWQTQADSRKHCSGAPSRLQSEECGGVGLWKQAGQLAGWAEAVCL